MNETIENISLKGEVWVDIKGYENIYKISNMGRIFILSRLVKFPNGGFVQRGLRIKSAHKDKDGYLKVSLTDSKGRAKTFTVHRLVALNFLGISTKPQIDHINGIRDDNRLENLRWVSSKENANFDLAKKNRSISQKKSHIANKKIFEEALEKISIPVFIYKPEGDYVERVKSISLACRKYKTDIAISKRIKNNGYCYSKGYIFSKSMLDKTFFPYKPRNVRRAIEVYDEHGNLTEVCCSILSACKKYSLSKFRVQKGIESKTKFVDILT